ncbi:ATP-binding cassette sub-family A member 3-like, partial [Varroa jacobsoni]|uniref:ABC transporter domain-containing protein n=1 Tax=Varroa destructor TaxID=109461 RepID=A0A7M7K9C7_VARDE
NEGFGLLGVNGAGKITTFRMFSGDLLTSGGDAFISNCSLKASVKRFSGGNRRKLPVGLAILGGPRVILLDEPTAGVDLEARREI